MPKTTFVRKPSTINNVREETQWLKNCRGGKATDSYYIAKEMRLTEQEFLALCEDFLTDREWCRAFSNQQYPVKGDAVPAILVTCEHSMTVLIIDPQGYSYPRYVALGKALK